MLEAVVQTATKHVQPQVDVGRDAAIDRAAGGAAEVGVEILDLGRPVVGDGAFEARADTIYGRATPALASQQ